MRKGLCGGSVPGRWSSMSRDLIEQETTQAASMGPRVFMGGKFQKLKGVCGSH